ncbi:Histidinol-phosphate aminotransferase [Hibiscus syriacus]|uniref:histidinol-phosphate transaminase n=1 Tax=Hibiscus syriacus TaxID=106335 RepID=A0A6A3ARW0_HIBSY|nr:Histidinol-phosphate aminotransferase [Hibiscus syriacus]
MKLDANENPYGPPLEVLEALGSLKFPSIYPEPESRQLRAALAEDSGIESDYTLVGWGCDELIDLIMRCVLDPGDKILDCLQPSQFPRKPDISLNVEAMAEAVEWEKPDGRHKGSGASEIIYGDFRSLRTLLLTCNVETVTICCSDLFFHVHIVLIAPLLSYIEFSGTESRTQWVKKHDNLIVLRTFSKRAGLAGICVGYGSFPLSINEYLWRAKQPYNASLGTASRRRERDKMLLQIEQECLDVYKRTVEQVEKSRAELLLTLSEILLEIKVSLALRDTVKASGTIQAAIAPALEQLWKQKAERVKEFADVILVGVFNRLILSPTELNYH